MTTIRDITNALKGAWLSRRVLKAAACDLEADSGDLNRSARQFRAQAEAARTAFDKQTRVAAECFLAEARVHPHRAKSDAELKFSEDPRHSPSTVPKYRKSPMVGSPGWFPCPCTLQSPEPESEP
jgi:hypothetical protein